MTHPEFSVDHTWEKNIYSHGQQLNRWPFDIVVQFIFRNCPADKPRSSVRVLEVGCGAGNNLWFAAREGMQVAGIDSSQSAVEYARKRLAEDDLRGDIRCGDIIDLPFDSDSFDLAIDRWSISCMGFDSATRAVSEVRRTLRKGGKFLFNCGSDQDGSYNWGKPGPQKLRLNIEKGRLAGLAQVALYDRQSLPLVLGDGWSLLSVEHHLVTNEMQPSHVRRADWVVIAEKT